MGSSMGMGRAHYIHFVGIGGVGMSGIAEVLHNLGYEVSGSDLAQNRVTKRLAEIGIKISIGHDSAHVGKSDAVVVSSAIDIENPEISYAKEHRIPVIPRAEMLAELMRFRYGIAIAGTHGKTTTTSLVASLLAEGDLDPTYVIGGRLNSSGTHARLGDSRYLVAEADESDASFLHLQPVIGVLTNIDLDHMETYGGEVEKLREAFLEFMARLPFYGLAVVCYDDPMARGLLSDLTKPVLTFGTDKQADVRATNVKFFEGTSSFEVKLPKNEKTFPIKLNMPGLHNVLNSLAAISVAYELGVSEDAICRGLENFQGIGRRFQIHGSVQIDQSNALVVDDYGHHPSEIAATISAVREGWAKRRLVMVFQPHRYTRTRDLFEDFVQILSKVDVLILLDIYSAGEKLIKDADSKALSRAIRLRGQIDPIFVDHPDEIVSVIPGFIEDDDIVLVMGAGSIGHVAEQLIESYGGKAA
ncbi:MAG: UDP-N-acetylmuramate--L-alanine ligase [Gammaproteobacteria bacterium]